MAPSTQIILSGMLTFGTPLALALRELMSLRRRRDGGGWQRQKDPVPPAPKPLPDCLIPKPMRPAAPQASRPRIPELV